MRWFRHNIKTGSRLALFALAIQFALSFGHFHLDPARASGQSSVEGFAPTEVSQQQPANHDTDHHPGEKCAVCAIITLAGSLALSPPPVLLLPEAIELLYFVTDAELAHLNSGRLPFQPRAPPAS